MSKLRKKLAATMVVAGLSMIGSTAFAENTSGPILRLREGRAPGRVSIQMQKAYDPCPQKGWYAYEDANGSARVRTDLLIAAYSSRRHITINGTGQCDEFGVETIDYIDVQ